MDELLYELDEAPFTQPDSLGALSGAELQGKLQPLFAEALKARADLGVPQGALLTEARGYLHALLAHQDPDLCHPSVGAALLGALDEAQGLSAEIQTTAFQASPSSAPEALQTSSGTSEPKRSPEAVPQAGHPPNRESHPLPSEQPSLWERFWDWLLPQGAWAPALAGMATLALGLGIWQAIDERGGPGADPGPEISGHVEPGAPSLTKLSPAGTNANRVELALNNLCRVLNHRLMVVDQTSLRPRACTLAEEGQASEDETLGPYDPALDSEALAAQITQDLLDHTRQHLLKQGREPSYGEAEVRTLKRLIPEALGMMPNRFGTLPPGLWEAWVEAFRPAAP